jgi:IS5 family transposase
VLARQSGPAVWLVPAPELHNCLAPRLVRQVAHYAPARQFKRMRRALRALRSRMGRVERVQQDIERQLQRFPLTCGNGLMNYWAIPGRILQQPPKDKLYTLHAPEVECISKGKAGALRVRRQSVERDDVERGRGGRSAFHAGQSVRWPHAARSTGQVEILSDVKPEVVFVDLGYKGVEVAHVQIWRSGQKRGVTRGLKAMIRRRSAIEPTIGHMKRGGKLDRNWLKGALGDALNAVPCGAGYNIRLIINKLRSSTSKALAY